MPVDRLSKVTGTNLARLNALATPCEPMVATPPVDKMRSFTKTLLFLSAQAACPQPDLTLCTHSLTNQKRGAQPHARLTATYAFRGKLEWNAARPLPDVPLYVDRWIFTGEMGCWKRLLDQIDAESHGASGGLAASVFVATI